MRTSISIAVLSLLVASSARAQGEPVAPHWVDRCAAGSDDARRAGEALDAFSGALHAHDPSAPLDSLRAQFGALLRLPCFDAAEESFDGRPSFRSLASLRAWWADGGLEWLHHYAHGVTAGEPVRIVFAPDEAPGLSLESTAADHPLRALLCSERDARCGLETAGWAVRAEAAFHAHAARERAAITEGPQSEAGTREGIAQCERDALGAPAERRFITYFTCVDRYRRRASIMPVGRARAPSRGWLIVRGRRGHYSSCDEVRAYELATGAAYVASTCAPFSAPSRDTDVVGRIPIDAIREVAWMLLVSPYVDELHRGGSDLVLPAAIGTRWRATGETDGGMFGSGWGSSAQTLLTWAWVDGPRVLAEGTLTWPDSSRAWEHHAADLLRVAEAAITPGCAPTVLPRALALGGASATAVGETAARETAARETAVRETAAREAAQRARGLLDRLRALRAPRCR